MRYILLILFILFSQMFYAQPSRRNYVGLAVGPSFPLSSFKNTQISDSTSGFAKTGVGFTFNYSYRFTHNLGVIVLINYGSNGFNYEAYTDSLEVLHPTHDVSVINNSNWSGGGILGGLFLTFPFSDNFSWDVRGSFGFYGIYSPQVTINAVNKDDPNDKSEYYRERASAFSYVYSFGTGFKYALNNYYILVFVDYYNSPLTFKNAYGWDWDNQPFETTFKQNVSKIELTFGIGYFF